MRQRQHLMAAYLLMTVAVVVGIGWAAHAWTPLNPATSGRFHGTTGRGRATRPSGSISPATCAPLKKPVRRFGYQFTFFRIGVSQDASRSGSAWAAMDIIMGHAALTESQDGRGLSGRMDAPDPRRRHRRRDHPEARGSGRRECANPEPVLLR